MKVLQTLGSSGRTGLPGIFFYKRTPKGVDIYNCDSTLDLHIPNKDWQKMLNEISQYGLFALSSDDGLYGILNSCNYTNTTHKSRIAAILEHEGSIDLNGRGNSPINLVNNM